MHGCGRASRKGMREGKRKKREGGRFIMIITSINYRGCKNPTSAAGQLEKKKSQSEKLPFAMGSGCAERLITAQTMEYK